MSSQDLKVATYPEGTLVETGAPKDNVEESYVTDPTSPVDGIMQRGAIPKLEDKLVEALKVRTTASVHVPIDA